MTLLQRTLDRIQPPDDAIAAEIQRRLDRKTHPPGSLGRLEELACAVGAIRRTAAPALPVKAIVLMAGDHGVVEEGVSPFPQAVTAQMVRNFAAGGAGINALARQAGARLLVVDVGVKEELPPLPGVRSARIGAGTRNMAHGPAMTREEAVRALELGIAVAEELADDGVTLLGIGEMGIGNTTPASALTAVYTGVAPAEVTGRGSGLDEAAWRHKIDVIRRALQVNAAPAGDAIDVLARLGGFEIAGLAGVVLGAAARGVPLLADGFIATAGALAAVRIAPASAGAVLASHRSVEVGHRVQLEALGKRPLLELDLRLGEGTGAALAMTLVEAGLRVLHEMASFDDAGVSGAVR